MKAFSRILLTGGGTAGHVNPALAIGRALGDERTAYLYVGVRGRAEAEVVPREGIPITFVRAAAYPGRAPVAQPGCRSSSISCVGTAKAAVHRADVPAGDYRRHGRVRLGADHVCGGDPAAVRPAAGRRCSCTSRTRRPGKLNLLVGRLADRVFVSFPETVADFPGNGAMAGLPAAAADPEGRPRDARGGARLRRAGRAAGRVCLRRVAGRAHDQPRAWWTRSARCCRTRTGCSSSTAPGCGAATARTIRRGRAGAAARSVHGGRAPGHRRVLRVAAVLPRYRAACTRSPIWSSCARAPARSTKWRRWGCRRSSCRRSTCRASTR